MEIIQGRNHLVVDGQGGARFDRLEELIGQSNAAKSQDTVAVCCLKQHAAPERPLPRLVVFSGPSGVGKGKLMSLLEETMGERFAKTISHTVGITIADNKSTSE